MFVTAAVLSLRNKKLKDPTLFTDGATKLEAGGCQLKLPEVSRPSTVPRCAFADPLCVTVRVSFPQGAAGAFYNIDNEEYEAMPVEVRLLPRKLRFFISAERREELLSQLQRG